MCSDRGLEASASLAFVELGPSLRQRVVTHVDKCDASCAPRGHAIQKGSSVTRLPARSLSPAIAAVQKEVISRPYVATGEQGLSHGATSIATLCSSDGTGLTSPVLFPVLRPLLSSRDAGRLVPAGTSASPNL